MAKTKRGHNNITIYATVELKQLIEKIKHDQKQNLLYDAHFVARNFLIRYKDVFIEMFGMEKYEEELEKWSRTQNEIRDENKRNKEEAIKRKEEALALERERLEVWKQQIGYEEESETEEDSVKCPSCGQPYGSNENCRSCRKKAYQDALKKHEAES